MTTARELAGDLLRIGVVAGDVVMVHASLRRIGPVEDGATGVIEALDLAVGPGGTLLMTLGDRDDWAWVNQLPPTERAGSLAEAVPFDCLRAPADPDVGVLAEVFRQCPGTLVSDHPEGRFGARGHLAHQLTSDVPWDDYYGPGSPLERLCQAHGKVLRLGADPDTVTLLHYAEYLAPLSSKRRVVRHRRVLGSDGPEIRTITCLDDTNGVADHPGEDYFALILGAYLRTGRGRGGVVGRARSELIDAADLVDFGVAWMAENLAPGA